MESSEKQAESNRDRPVQTTNLIVVGFDGSESSIGALRKARELAEDDHELLVVHAYSVPAYLHKYPYFDELTAKAEAAAREVLDAARDEIGDTCDRFSFEIAPGKPASLLSEFAKQRSAKMVVVGSRGLGKVRAILGSQSRRLISIAPCPVMVVPDHADNKAH